MLLVSFIILSLSILFSIYVPFNFSLCLIVLCLGIIFIANKTQNNSFLNVLIIIFVLAFLSVNWKNYQLQNEYKKIVHFNNQNIVIFGKVVKTAEPKIVIKSSHIIAGKKSIKVKLMIPLYSFEKNIYFYDQIKCEGKLAFEEGFKKLNLQKCSLEKTKDSPLKAVFVFKAKLLSILRNNLPAFYADFLAGLLIGVNGIKLDPELELIFRDLGLLHMLVVSGAQVALLTNCLLAFLTVFSLPNLFNFIIVSIFNTVFLLIVGSDLSVMRAVVMMQIALFLTYNNRSREALDVLYVSGMVLLIIDPYNLLKLSFILSFLATYAVIDIAPRIEQIIKKHFNIPAFFAETISISLGPILLTSPVILYAYHRIDLLSLFSNIVIGPFIEIIVVYGFLALIIAFIIPILAKMLFLFILGLLVTIHFIARLFYKIPFHTFYVSQILIVNIFAYYAFIITLFYFPRRFVNEGKFIFMMLFLIFGINLYFIIRMPDGELYFYSRQNAHYLVWSQPRFNVLILLGQMEEYNLNYFLNNSHIYQINYLISNHNETDWELIKNLNIKQMLDISGNSEKVLIVKDKNQKVLLEIHSGKKDISLFNSKIGLSILLVKEDSDRNLEKTDIVYLCNNININSMSNKIVVTSSKYNKDKTSDNMVSSYKAIIKLAYDSKHMFLKKL